MEKDRPGMMKQLPFNMGVKCLEQSVSEVDLAVRDFTSNCAYGNLLSLYSWKFPHLKLEKLEIGIILRNLRNQNLAGDIHYLHLTELLIDRLYFTLMSAIRFVSMLTSVACDGNSDASRRTTPISDVGCDGDFLGLSVVNPLCSDSKVFNTNMALVVRHFQNLLNDLEGVIHSNVSKLRKFEVLSPGSEDNDSSYSSTRRMRSCVTQTEITSIECCEICTLCQEAIKKVGETLESCLTSISPKEHSAVAHARIDITKNLFTNTQWSAVTRWCEALSADTQSMTQVTRDLLKRNGELEQELKKTCHNLNTNTRDHQLAMQKLEKKCSTLESQVQVKKKEKTEWVELQRFLEDKVAAMEQKVSKQGEDLKKETGEKESLQQALSTLEKAHQELKYSQTTHSQTLRRIQQDLLEEQKYKETVQGNIVTLETSNRKYRLDIAKLRSDVVHSQREKAKLEEQLNEVKAELLRVTDQAAEKKESELGSLKKELRQAEQKIELLTLFPDLNGPINTPESENEDVVQTMEKQLQGNTMRVQILLQQSEKLAATLKKLKKSKKFREN